jgi:hypothetical protein
MPNTLSNTHRIILTHAAAHPRGRVQPTPSTLNKNVGAITQSLRAMLASGYIVKVPTSAGDVEWTTLPDGVSDTLAISERGRAALGSGAAIASATSPTTQNPEPPRAGSKLALILELLGAPEGATVDELATATEWKKHSVRGALSGALKRKRNVELSSELVDGRGRVYRIVEPAAEALLHPQVEAGERQ